MSSGGAPRLHRSVGYTHRIPRLLLIHPSSFRFAISVSSTYCSCLPIRYVLCCGRDCLFPPSPPSARFAQYALSGGPSVCLSLSMSLPLALSFSNTAPVSLSIRPSPRLSACLHLCLTACLLVCPSVCRAGSLSLRTFLKPLWPYTHVSLVCPSGNPPASCPRVGGPACLRTCLFSHCSRTFALSYHFCVDPRVVLSSLSPFLPVPKFGNPTKSIWGHAPPPSKHTARRCPPRTLCKSAPGVSYGHHGSAWRPKSGGRAGAPPAYGRLRT